MLTGGRGDRRMICLRFFFVSTIASASESRVENVTAVSFVGVATVRGVMLSTLSVEGMTVKVERYVDVIMVVSYIMLKIDKQ